MDKLKEWAQIYEEYKTLDSSIDQEDKENQMKVFQFNIQSIPQLFNQQSVSLMLVYKKNFRKHVLSNICEMQSQESLLVQCMLKSDCLVLLLRVNCQRTDEEVIIECKQQIAHKGYKTGLRSYLAMPEIDQTLEDARCTQLQYQWNETQPIDGIILENFILYNQKEIDALHQAKRLLSSTKTSMSIDQVRLVLTQQSQQQQQSGSYALMIKQHNGLACISQQIMPLQQSQPLTFTSSSFSLKLTDQISLATFIYLIEQANNQNIILGYVPFDLSIQNQQMNIISQGKTILNETIKKQFQGNIFIKNQQYQQIMQNEKMEAIQNQQQNIKSPHNQQITIPSPLNQQQKSPSPINQIQNNMNNNNMNNQNQNNMNNNMNSQNQNNMNNNMNNQNLNNMNSMNNMNNQNQNNMNNMNNMSNNQNQNNMNTNNMNSNNQTNNQMGRDQELEFLRNKVAQLEQNNHQSSSYQPLQETLQNREEVFVQHLNQIREDNKLIFAQKEDEFQKLKEVILDLKDQNINLASQGQQKLNDPLMNKVQNIVQIHKGKQFAESKHQILDPQYGMRELSRKDRAQFASGPWGQTLENNQNIQVDLQQEYEDNKRQLVFTIQFLGLEKKLVELAGMHSQNKSILNESYVLPNKVYFTINFYDFGQFKSDEYQLNSGGLLVQQRKKTSNDSHYIFRVDSSDHAIDQDTVQLNYQQICEYLYSKSINIDIWDSDSLLLFGNVQIRLQELLRQGQDTKQIMKSVDIRDTLMCRIKGALKVVMTVKAQQCSQINYVTNTHQLQEGKPLLQNKLVSRRRKVKSTNPLQLPTTFQPDTQFTQREQETAGSQDNRIKDKINAYKRHCAVNNMSGLGGGGEQIENREKRRRELELINQYREEKKKGLVREIQEQLVEEERRVIMQQGILQIQTYQVLNSGNHDTLYRVAITDEDNQYLLTPEVQLVTNAMEWRHHLQYNNHISPPIDYDLITQDGAFILKPNESLTLIFKILTLRNTNLPSSEYQQQKNDKYMKERSVVIQLGNREGQILGGISLQLKCRNSVIDQVVRQYQGAEKFIDMIIYNPQLNTNNRVMFISYPKASVKYQNADELSIELKTNQVGQLLLFNLFIFSDIYYSKLINNIQLEVNSVQQIDVNLTLGQETQVQLPIFSDLPRICSLHSSHLLCLHFPAPFNQQFSLTPASYTFINASVKSFSEMNEQVLVNCVDQSSKELVFSWLVNVSTSVPKVSAVVELQVDTAIKQTKTFFYLNRLPHWTLYQIASSKPDILAVQDQQIPIDSGAKAMVKLSIESIHQDTTVFLFINDKDQSLFDTVLINLHVQNHHSPI